MNKVNVYMLKNFLYVFLLANIIALLFRGRQLFVWMNVIALVICVLVFLLIRLTVRRYAAEFQKSRDEVRDLLGQYIEDEQRGKTSFHDYLKGKGFRNAPRSQEPAR